MKTRLAPILDRDEYSAPLAQELVTYLDEILFGPMRAIIGEDSVRANSPSALHAAITTGRVVYRDNAFRGQFSAEISKELRAMGAALFGSIFVISMTQVPWTVRDWLRHARERDEQIHKALIGFLALALLNLGKASTGVQFAKIVDKTIADLQRQLIGSVAEAGLPAAPKLPEAVATGLREQVETGTTFSVVNFTTEQITELRAKIALNLENGGGLQRLADLIEASYGVSRRRAEIIARSEFSLAVARFREERYRELGITQYVWETSHDERVRPTHGETNNHRVLDGRTFAFDDPPIVDSATGRRRNPGEDYGPCRCVPIPVVNV